MSEISGDVVLITGAGGSLGCALTRVFVRAGCKVAGLDVSDDALSRFSTAADAAGGRGLPIHADLRDWQAAADAVHQVARDLGGLDILINNATARTTPVFKPIEDCSFAELTLLSEVGPYAALGMMRAALPYLKKRPGTVINVGSGAGLAPPEGLGPYGMIKAATHLLTRAAAREWGKYGITVNGILPFVMTEQLAVGLRETPDRIPMPPLGRAGDGETDIGTLVQFLAGPGASFVTGQNIPVDGGNDMMR